MNRWRICNAVMIVAGMSSVMQAGVSAACWYPDEVQADQVKDFQYMMMVGSLQCSNGGGPSREAYNAFVNSKRIVLDSKGYVLKAHFLRENGIQDGRAAYDRSATVMSNRHAGRFDDPSFCATISSYTRMAVTASDADFITLAQLMIEPPSGSCAASGYNTPVVAAPAPVRRTGSAYAPEPYARSSIYPNDVNYPLPGNAPAPVAVAEPAVAQQADAEPVPPLPGRAPPAPLLQPVTETAPVAQAAPIQVAGPVKTARAIPVAAHTTVIANAPIVPPTETAAAPSATDALQAAITALQAATDALKAQAHPSN